MGSREESAARVAVLRERLGDLTLADAHRVGRRLDAVRRERRGASRTAAAPATASIERAIEEGELRLGRRRDAVPAITYPAELPITQRRDDIAAAIRDHQVVVVAGETGSGKTTQLPKICLELGRGVRGMVGHTQPRRIAARSVAERLAYELSVPVGAAVGYAVRFTDEVGPETLVKVMTDGILLAEIQRDRDLLRYDTIIVDEAHERSLNIDFLLGYLTRLLPRRPDLKLVITSATIDPERFAGHFGDALGANVPIVEVSGRTYPVEVRYQPLDEREQTEAVSEAVLELEDEGPGDVLVFLSGEREIRDTADALTELSIRETEVLPLYGRLSMAEQHRVFAPHTGRRIVLATNVAETSLTVPGVRYVVDAGTARISRYSVRTKVQRLPIEPISQASAHQRAGRCGRLADGICIRLYSEDDYESRPEFTEPEIQRTSLAAVILQMAALGLGDIEAFPFIDPPDHRQVRDGVALLAELGALGPPGPSSRTGRRGRSGATAEGGPQLTFVGRRLAQLPVDPRLGRMILAAQDSGCVREVVVIAAALSIQDPRERPTDAQQQADEMHRRFAAPDSDFIAYLNLWAYLREQQQALSSSAFRRMCRREYLHYLRIREWQDLVAQLRRALGGIGVPVTTAGGAATDAGVRDMIHQALLAGLLSHVGLKDSARNDYLGARGARFVINPGSVLFKSRPDWVMAGELVETTRLWARTCARVDPGWVERAATHLLVRTYSEPHWSQKRGAAVANERVTLYGVPLVAARSVQYDKVDPAHARELFVRHALVEGEWRTHHEFWLRNAERRAEVEGLEDRVRRRDIVVDDDAIYDFYDARVPAEVVSVRHFDAWWKHARHDDPGLLSFDRDFLLGKEVSPSAGEAYPGTWHQDELSLDITYRFEPGSPDDGVTVHVPLAVLNQLRPAGFDWQVPGVREELATALVRSLPKALRRQLVPAPDRARAALGALAARGGVVGSPDVSMVEALARELTRGTGVVIAASDFDLAGVPVHLRVGFSVTDESGAVLATGKDLTAIRAELGVAIRDVVARVGADLERTGLTSWDFPALPRVIERTIGGQLVRGYPALVDEGKTVGVRVLGDERSQRRAMRAGVRRLLRAVAPAPGRLASVHLDTAAKLALTYNPHGSVEALFDDCLACAIDGLVERAGGLPWDAIAYARVAKAVRADIAPVLLDVIRLAAEILSRAHDVTSRLDALTSSALKPTIDDARDHLGTLVYPGFVSVTGQARLRDLGRYAHGLQVRLEVVRADPERDLAGMQRVHPVEDAYALATQVEPSSVARDEALDEVRWMLEELRVSVFAQRLGTAYAVSEKRVRRALADLSAAGGDRRTSGSGGRYR